MMITQIALFLYAQPAEDRKIEGKATRTVVAATLIINKELPLCIVCK